MYVAPLISAALARGEAVVALESTVLTHGLPKPDNLELARSLERLVREGGAVPATVGIVKGNVVVGLSEDELEYLSRVTADKASLWNLASVMAGGQTAGTTVATTLYAAHRAGIRVFSTGGIGGVHPQPPGAQVVDESADLLALAQYPLLVVCSGAKSILNVEATVERLETLGIGVIGYQSDYFAGFYTPQTRFAVAARLDRTAQIALAFKLQEWLGLKQAILVSRPVSQGLAEHELAGWLEQAGEEASQKGLKGKNLTPFLLARLAELSSGRSLEVNLRLLKENAALAAALAGEVAKLAGHKADLLAPRL
jgi:pseudouridine-5'-phosphate glycosidase